MPRRDHNRQDLSELEVGGILSTVLPRAIRFCCRKDFQRSRNDRNLLAVIVAAQRCYKCTCHPATLFGEPAWFSPRPLIRSAEKNRREFL